MATAATPKTAAPKTAGATDSRQRFIDVALRLFTQHSFAGTSLQMIADELGVTKAAVYHHFHTREELLNAVVEPVLEQLRAIVDAAEGQRTVHARAEHMLTGYADLAVRNRALISVLAADRGVIEILRAQVDLGTLINRQVKLLADVDPGPAGLVKAALVFAGIAGAVGPALVELDDKALNQHLTEAGRRTLGLRTPRRPTPGTPRP
ncbi:TetR family transcriptional regulator [Kribbella sp. VKM Ac-2527]|uniref:TetR family transcriptional regulator n=1 Tax=Kribbella caucasensis TaxID=2512215 RepID=A0A4R6J6D4_9ACTN|nr:TetR/AcrR family transcriptional regulator [Kribbella sp. VKM Ac-2527]TDO30627.1 TetR family transcriptional regulator [Kribbella sp. VKM Ac-2527]